MDKNIKKEVINITEDILKKANIKITSVDKDRPWGGFYVIDETDKEAFVDTFFPDIPSKSRLIAEKISPKLLLIKPGQRLSWQYHERRAEIWRVIQGEVGVYKSLDNNEGELHKLGNGQKIELERGERHRLVGLADWAIVAEIWKHTDVNNPSDEDDIVRLQDDYGRN